MKGYGGEGKGTEVVRCERDRLKWEAEVVARFGSQSLVAISRCLVSNSK